jgi:hypothetical protein
LQNISSKKDEIKNKARRLTKKGLKNKYRETQRKTEDDKKRKKCVGILLSKCPLHT